MQTATVTGLFTPEQVEERRQDTDLILRLLFPTADEEDDLGRAELRGIAKMYAFMRTVDRATDPPEEEFQEQILDFFLQAASWADKQAIRTAQLKAKSARPSDWLAFYTQPVFERGTRTYAVACRVDAGMLSMLHVNWHALTADQRTAISEALARLTTIPRWI